MITHTNPVSMDSLRVVRVMKKLSQRELAQAAGITPARLWKLENGVAQPKEDELFKLLGVLTSEG